MVDLLAPQLKSKQIVDIALSLNQPAIVWGDAGTGKTTLLRTLHQELGGVFITINDFIKAMRSQNPLAMEEALDQLFENAFEQNDVVIVDDLHPIFDVICSCNGESSRYPRANWANAVLIAVLASLNNTTKKLIIGSTSSIPYPLYMRAIPAGIEDFTSEDYAQVCRAYLTVEQGERLDYAKIFRFAPKLNLYQLRSACTWLKSEGDLDTERFIDYLRSQKLTSNVDLAEVQSADLRDLKGVEDVIEALEANIIMPLENDALAMELGIKPKRGVLLVGPPGTGKTTVGRALAHRLKSKFFLVDGTVVSGSSDFYYKLNSIVNAAKENAPSILFIDDSDVIFESGKEYGLYRYLLTLLDGLESETSGQVCVILTAMNMASIPPALIRSGRIELWLETRLPDEEARYAILEVFVTSLAPAFAGLDTTVLASQTEGLTGADLKRLIEDGKILFAYDKVRGKELRPITEYFLQAIETIRTNKERYVEAEATIRQQHPDRPSWFDAMGAMMAMQGEGS